MCFSLPVSESMNSSAPPTAELRRTSAAAQNNPLVQGYHLLSESGRIHETSIWNKHTLVQTDTDEIVSTVEFPRSLLVHGEQRVKHRMTHAHTIHSEIGKRIPDVCYDTPQLCVCMLAPARACVLACASLSIRTCHLHENMIDMESKEEEDKHKCSRITGQKKRSSKQKLRRQEIVIASQL